MWTVYLEKIPIAVTYNFGATRPLKLSFSDTFYCLFCLKTKLHTKINDELYGCNMQNSQSIIYFQMQWNMLKVFCICMAVPSLKLVSACVFFIKFLFSNQIIALQKLWNVSFISSKKLFSFWRYSDFCNFFPSFPHFPNTKGQTEVE